MFISERDLIKAKQNSSYFAPIEVCFLEMRCFQCNGDLENFVSKVWTLAWK